MLCLRTTPWEPLLEDYKFNWHVSSHHNYSSLMPNCRLSSAPETNTNPDLSMKQYLIVSMWGHCCPRLCCMSLPPFFKLSLLLWGISCLILWYAKLPHQGFPGGSDGKRSACNEGNLGLTPRLWRSPGREQGNPLQYSWMGNHHGQRSLVGYSPWGLKESDMTEWLNTA